MSERQPDGVTACPIRRGDCMLLDYRTLHTGLPNQGTRVRPILYMVYARGWFFDDANHFGVNSPDLSLLTLSAFEQRVVGELNYALMNQLGISFTVPVVMSRVAAVSASESWLP